MSEEDPKESAERDFQAYVIPLDIVTSFKYLERVRKLEKDREELGASDKDHRTGGGQPKGIWDVLQGGSAGSVAFQVGDVGIDPHI